ncbi:MAG: diaminopimelate epimerase [Planctomycetota bacterium]
MHFTKLHGLGNDYLFVNGFDHVPHDPAGVAREASDRHRGVGSDGLILVMPPSDGIDASARMWMFNADGSEGEMCGNGIRCVCKFVHDHGIGPNPHASPMRIETACGVLSLHYQSNGDGKIDRVTVDMGEPKLGPEAVGVTRRLLKLDETSYEIPLRSTSDYAPSAVMRGVFVSMGNPHVVIFRDTLGDDDHLVYGPPLENAAYFENRINSHFVEVLDTTHVKVTHWERGSGATLACGTGACAVCVAGVVTGKTERKITAELPGGPLELEWRGTDHHVYMTGPAVEVFSGEWPG